MPAERSFDLAGKASGRRPHMIPASRNFESWTARPAGRYLLCLRAAALSVLAGPRPRATPGARHQSHRVRTAGRLASPAPPRRERSHPRLRRLGWRGTFPPRAIGGNDGYEPSVMRRRSSARGVRSRPMCMCARAPEAHNSSRALHVLFMAPSYGESCASGRVPARMRGCHVDARTAFDRSRGKRGNDAVEPILLGALLQHEPASA